MAVGHGLLGVNVLAQGGVQQGALQVVGGKGVARQEAVGVAVFDEQLHGLAGVGVEGEGRPHDPDDIAVVLLVAEKLHQPVIVPGVGGLPAAAGAENEAVFQLMARLHKAGAVHEDALLAVFGAAQDDPVALAEVAVFHHIQTAVRAPDHAGVHAAFRRQGPLAVQLVVLGVHGGAVVALGGDAVPLAESPSGVRGMEEALLGEIGSVIGGKLKSHGIILSLQKQILSFVGALYRYLILFIPRCPDAWSRFSSAADGRRSSGPADGGSGRLSWRRRRPQNRRAAGLCSPDGRNFR